MTKDLTPKQENFAQVYVETSNASEAYRQAYDTKTTIPESVHQQACRVLADVNVASRIIQLQEEHRERHSVTVDSLCIELDEARTLALEERTAAPAVTATMGKAKLHGLGVENRNSTITGALTLSEAEKILSEVGLNDD